MSAFIIATDQLKIENKPVVTGIPPSVFVEYFGEIPEHFGKIAERIEFIILRPVKDWDYNSFLCFVRNGFSEGFKSVHIKNVTRYRDGGTTDIETEIGNFHFPSCFQKDATATFNGCHVNEYDRSLNTKHLL